MNGRIGGLLLLAAALSVGGQPANVAEEEIRDLIDRLDDDDYGNREAATDRLRAMGAAIFPVIDRTDIERLDPEAAGRLRPIIDTMGWMPPDIRKTFDAAVNLLKSRDKLDRRKGLAAILALDTRAAAGLRNILAQGEGTCEIRTTVDRHTYEGGGTIEASVALHNTGTTPFWVCLPGTETPCVGNASTRYDVNCLKRIEPTFVGFPSSKETFAGCGTRRRYRNDGLLCICDRVGNLLDHFVLLSPGESVDLGKQPIVLPAPESIAHDWTRIDASKTPVVASIKHFYTAEVQKPSYSTLEEASSMEWTFCSHTNARGWVVADTFRVFRFKTGYLWEIDPPTFTLLPKINATNTCWDNNDPTCRLSLGTTTLAKGEDISLWITLSTNNPHFFAEVSQRVWDPRSKKFPLVIVIRDAAGEVVEAGPLSGGILGETVLTPDDVASSTTDLRWKNDISATLPVHVNLKEGNYTLFAVLVSRKLRNERANDHWWSGSLVTNRVDFTVGPARVR